MSRSRVSYDGFEGQPSPASSDDRSLERQASVRVGKSGARVSIARSSRAGSSPSPSPPATGRQRSSRARRPTPIVRRGGNNRRSSANRSSALTDEEFTNESSPVNNTSNSRSRSGRGRRSRMQADIETSNGQVRHIAATSSSSNRMNSSDLSWYERLLPEFLLNLSAPITGYEDRLDLDTNEEDFEILERQRLKRNKRIRRRLLTVMLIATAAGVFMYTKGRMFRKVGVKAAVNTMKHRIEGGLAKSIQETMGK